jgi:hypothetical protein
MPLDADHPAPPPSPPPAAAGRRFWRWAGSLASAVLLVVLWLSLLQFPTAVAGPALDESWQQSLGYFFKHRLQAGTDYVFTYGPLGFLVGYVYDADLFWLKYGWEIAVKLLAAWMLVRWAGRLPGWPLRLAYGFVAIFYVPPWLMYDQELFLFLLLLLGLGWLCTEEPPHAWKLLPGILLMAVLALTKFTVLTYTLATGAVIGLAWLLRGQYRSGLLLLIGLPLAVVLCWCLLGQDPVHLPAYLRLSSHISSGYTEAMAAGLLPVQLALGITFLVLVTGLVAAYPRGRLLQGRSLVVLALTAGALLIEWKLGFVRQDGHCLLFWNFAALVPFALLGWYGSGLPRQGRRTILALAGVALAVFARIQFLGQPFHPAEMARASWNRLQENRRLVSHPRRCQRLWEAHLADYRTLYHLPRIAERVRQAPVDLFGVEQAVLFLNGLHYRPRPVFQSYSVYDPVLQSLNAAFYQGPDAPPYVLLKLAAIDGRLPAMEEGPALLAVLNRYVPVVSEKGYLLLAHRPPDHGPPPEGRLLFNRKIPLGQEIVLGDLPPGPLVLSVTTHPSTWGHLRALFYRLPALRLTVRTTAGRRHVYRLVPGMAQAGFLLSPLLRDNDEVLTFYRTGDGQQVQSFRISLADGRHSPLEPSAYQSPITVKLRQAPEWTAPGGTPLVPEHPAAVYDPATWPLADLAWWVCLGSFHHFTTPPVR